MRISIPFIGGTATSKSAAVNNQSTVNFMQAVKSAGAKAQYVLESTPGLIDLGAIGNGALRSSQMKNSKIRGTNDLYGVFGTKLVAQTLISGNIEVGTLDDNPGRVEMARGRSYLLMVDGISGYTYDGTTFAKITDLDFPANPTHATYADGFFIVNESNTDNYYISAIEDPTSWNALDFEAASVAPDAALALVATESTLWIIGDETAQAYYNSGNADFPYSVILSATQEVGILAPYSLAESSEGIFYLGTSPEGGVFIYNIRGHQGRRISSDEQETFLSTVIDPSSAYGFIYRQAGKSFYVLQLGATDGDDAKTSSTLIYNINVGKWETRESQDGTAWKIGGHGVLGNKNIGGSRLEARAFTLDLKTYSEGSSNIIRRRRTEIYHLNGHFMSWDEVVIDIEGGVGNIAAPGNDPYLRLRYSDDNGNTWSSYLRAPIGKKGKKEQRVVFNNLGLSRSRIYEIVVSDPVPVTIIAAYALVQTLRN